MRIKRSLLIISLFLTFNLAAQNSGTIRGVWDGRLVNRQTAEMPEKGRTSVFVVHYFGPAGENGIHDMFGIYAPANIQMGLEHGFTDDFSVYFLSEKNNKTLDLGFRYRFMQQDISDIDPVSIALALSVSSDARDEKFFGDNYFFINRFFYTGQLAVSRQIAPRWQLMTNWTYVHFNIVPEQSFSDFMSLTFSGAYKLSRKMALFSSVDLPVGIASASKEEPFKPNSILTLGTTLNSPTHNFQVFLSNGSQISPGKEMLNNQSGISLKNMRIGFNIHIKLGTKK